MIHCNIRNKFDKKGLSIGYNVVFKNSVCFYMFYNMIHSRDESTTN